MYDQPQMTDPPAQATDEQLAWLVATHCATLYRVAFAITRNRAMAEDVVQDVLFKAWTRMPSWDDEAPIRWLRRVTRNRALDVMKKEQRSTTRGTWDDLDSDNGVAVDRVIEGRERLSAIQGALDKLDETSRLLLVLRETEELSYEALADLTGLTPSAVKSNLYRARHALKAELAGWDL